MIKKEAKWQTVFNQYLRELQSEGKGYGYYELKQTDKDYISYSKIEAHQEYGLAATKASGLVWKFSDQDQRQKPCDCVSIPPLPSYIVIKFLDGFYIIDIEDFIIERDHSMSIGILSLTRQNAKSIAYKVIHID